MVLLLPRTIGIWTSTVATPTRESRVEDSTEDDKPEKLEDSAVEPARPPSTETNSPGLQIVATCDYINAWPLLASAS
jgi:hypothetical protein